MKMNDRMKSRRLALGLAALTVGAMVTGAGIFAGAGTSVAAEAKLTLVYSCPFPLIGVKDMTVKITATGLPEAPVVGQPTPEVDVTAVATVPADATSGLRLVDARTIEGKASADAKLDNAGLNLDLKIPLDVAKTPIPDSGPFDVVAKGKAPSFALPNPGKTTITVGNFLTTLTPRKENGDPTGLGTFESACTIKQTDPAQNALLYEATVKPSGPTTTTSTTTSTTTTTTTTSPTTTKPTSTTTAPPQDLEITYGLNGESGIKKLGSKVALGPGKFDAKVNLQSGVLDGNLALPKTKAVFKLFGIIDGESAVELLPVGKTTGTFQGGVVKSNTKITIRLPEVKVWGIPVVFSNTCQTTAPADVSLSSGPNFNPMVGGNLAGTYTIPTFAGCGPIPFVTEIVNMVTPGPDNTITLDLKKQ